jgi:hypothetical protein
MSGRRVRRRVSDTADTVVSFAANATNSASHGKILLVSAFAALLLIVAFPIFFRADMPSMAANSTLRCYDSAGTNVPCATRASAPPSRLNDRATGTHRPASWITTTLYQQASWPITAVDQPAIWTTGESAARPGSAPKKRPVLAGCGRRSIPCFFSALQRQLTHIASMAANVGQARPAGKHL